MNGRSCCKRRAFILLCNETNELNTWLLHTLHTRITELEHGSRDRENDIFQCHRERGKFGSSKEPYPTEYEALLGVQKDPTYPKSVFFIVVNEFCERFSFYGLRAILTLYLRNMLKYTENTTTVIYHAFVMFSYLTCVPGAIIADSLLGRFRTIFYLSLVYAIGNATLCFASIGTPPSLSWIPTVPLSFIGLGLVAIGTGGIKPCVSAFGGDQFQIPGQERALEQFFFIFYFSINMGSMISTFVTPILRRDVSCLDSETCYPLAFGLPALLMVTALVIFMMGKPFYKMKRPTGNVIVQITKCVWHALTNSRKGTITRAANEHWLDNANDKFDHDFIQDVKKLFSLILLFSPLPVFWSLFEQQGSRWTLQATRMNGVVFSGWTIKPDQMQVVNSILVLLFIPLFDQLLYPTLAKCHVLKKPLQRIAVGGFLASASFVIAGVVELKLEPTYANIPGPMESQINFVNSAPCQLNVSLSSTSPVFINNEDGGVSLFAQAKTLLSNENIVFNGLPADINYSVQIKPAQESDTCHFNVNTENGTVTTVVDFNNYNSKPFSIICEPGKAVTILIALNDMHQVDVKFSGEPDDLEKSQDGVAKLKVLFDDQVLSNEDYSRISIRSLNIFNGKNYEFNLISSGKLSWTTEKEVQPDRYFVNLMSEVAPPIIVGEIAVESGGVYVVTIYPSWTSAVSNANNLKLNLIEMSPPNSVHMLLLLPQYFVITTAEILFSITGYAFSYAEAPNSMKSVIQAVWLLTNGLGSLIVILVTEMNLFPRQMIQFFFFSGLMFAATLSFVLFAYRYTPVQPHRSASIFLKKTSLPAAMDNFFQLSEHDLTDEDDT